MITIFTTDGRTLSYEETEEVLILGTFDGPSFIARKRPVLDVRPGNWLYLSQCCNAADRDYDLVLVKNIAGKPIQESFTEWKRRFYEHGRAKVS